MKMKKRAKVHLLPTNDEKAVIGLTADEKTLWFAHSGVGNSYGNRHLYITDDSEIKEGDWFMFYDEPRQAKDLIAEPVNQGKIIATTDPQLRVECDGCKGKGVGEDGRCCTKGCGGFAVKRLPSIPQSFIEAYCKNPVDKVMVEYELVCSNCDEKPPKNEKCHGNYKNHEIPKLTSNNEIIISMIEEKLYTREEVESLLIKAIAETNYVGSRNVSVDPEQWIKDNL